MSSCREPDAGRARKGVRLSERQSVQRNKCFKRRARSGDGGFRGSDELKLVRKALVVVNLLDRVQDVELPVRERLPHLQVHVEAVAPADRLEPLLDLFDERLIVDADENGRLLAHPHLPLVLSLDGTRLKHHDHFARIRRQDHLFRLRGNRLRILIQDGSTN